MAKQGYISLDFERCPKKRNLFNRKTVLIESKLVMSGII